MKMKLKIAVSLLLVLALVLTGCSKGTSTSGEGGTEEFKHYKIGVALYTDSGKSTVAIKSFLDGIDDAMNLEFQFTTLSTYDEATNKTKIQELISAGCDGIITTVDMGTVSILEECEKAGVYLAGFLTDFNYSYYAEFDRVFGSEYFLGTVADGYIDNPIYSELVANKIIESGKKNIGIMIFPEFAYPNQLVLANVFTEKINEYNQTVDEAEKINVLEPTVLNFAPMEETYLSEHSEIDAIYSIAAAATNVYPVLVANNRTDISLYTSGFEGLDDADNFGTGGNGCYQGIVFSSPEAIAYPLVLMIDKLNGASFPDQPKVAERIDADPVIILSDEDMDAVKTHSIYYTGAFSESALNAEDVIALCASYNDKASYKELVNVVQSFTVENMK